MARCENKKLIYSIASFIGEVAMKAFPGKVSNVQLFRGLGLMYTVSPCEVAEDKSGLSTK